MVRFDLLHGKNMVCGMVCWWYGMMVPCRGCIIWLNLRVVGIICFSI